MTGLHRFHLSIHLSIHPFHSIHPLKIRGTDARYRSEQLYHSINPITLFSFLISKKTSLYLASFNYSHEFRNYDFDFSWRNSCRLYDQYFFLRALHFWLGSFHWLWYDFALGTLFGCSFDWAFTVAPVMYGSMVPFTFLKVRLARGRIRIWTLIRHYEQ